MKKTVLIIISFLILVSNPKFAQNDRPKIGLVLSGGGARGFAHIGILKMIDSLHIPIDYVAGTSMGGIIGALYAIGYSGNELERFVTESNWGELFSDKPARSDIPYIMKKYDGTYAVELGIKGFTPVIPSGMIQGQNVLSKFYELTSSVESIRDFDQFQTPFRCVAVDLITGQPVVLSKGSLAKAMRSTMAIPTVFSPVQWGDSLLIDGGILNNFPTDVAKNMGADIIIGVNVGTPLQPKTELNSIIGVLGQVMVLTDFAKLQENIKLCDLLIKPDLGKYTLGDFDDDQVKEILRLGNVTAQSNKKSFQSFKNQFVAPYEHKEENVIADGALIEGMSVSGSASYPLQYFYEALECRPFDNLDIIRLNDNISALETSGLFDNVKLILTPANNGGVYIHIEINEVKKPIIYGVEIEGNTELSFEFIYELLNLKPGEVYDEKILRERVTDLFSLGYFSHIGHTIYPVRDNYVRLVLDVTEKATRSLRVGYRYDDEYKLVGFLSIHSANVPFAGIRADFRFQFAGLFKVDYELTYPTRTLNFPLYPYLRFSYKDIPVNIFDTEKGLVIAEYFDNSLLIGAGMKLNLGSIGEVNFEYNHEYMNIKPTFAGLDPIYFPTWKDNLKVLRANISIDLLDDPILPRSGILFDASYDYSAPRISSEAHFHLFGFDAAHYHTISDRHTFRFFGSYWDFFRTLPAYKFKIAGGPGSFVGMDINQLAADIYGFLRIDYRYEFKKDIFFKLIANAGHFTLYNSTDGSKYSGPIYGAGIGVKFLSMIGPFEMIVSRGPKSLLNWKNLDTNFYFTAGFTF